MCAKISSGAQVLLGSEQKLGLLKVRTLAHIFNVPQADAAVLRVLGHPREACVRVRQVEVVYLRLPLPPVLPQVAALQPAAQRI